MEETLEGLKNWFSGFEDKPYWTLYLGNGKDIIQSNHTNDDFDESYESLETLILDQYHSGVSKFVVRHKTSKTDSKPSVWNVNFPRNRSRSGVGSVGASPQDFWIEKAMTEQAKAAQLQLENYKETSDLKQQIAVMIAQQHSWVSDAKDFIKELFNTDVAKAIGAKVASNFLAPAEQTAIIASLEQDEEANVPNESPKNNKTLGINEINELVAITEEMQKAGFENPIEALKKVANFAKTNTAVAKSFIDGLK